MVLSAKEAGWITWAGLGAALLALVVASVCIRLGFWQLGRLEQRRSLNFVIERAMALPPLQLDQRLLDSIARDPVPFVYRAARISGRYEQSGEVLLRGRSHAGSPGVHLVAPFRMAGDSSLLLVNRGWLPSPDGATVDPRGYRDTAEVTVEGILQLVPAAASGAIHAPIALPDTQIDSYRRLDRPTLTRVLGTEPPPVYLQRTPSASVAAPPIPVPHPTLDGGPHLGYAIQWFAFAAVALIGFAVTVLVRRRKPEK